MDSFSRNNNAWSNEPINNSPYPQKMPSPSDYPVINAWKESNKTLDETSCKSPISPEPILQQTTPIQLPQTVDQNISLEQHKSEIDSISNKPKTIPSKVRWFFRIALWISSIGYLGFAAGASPRSGKDIPFDSKACFYYLYAVAILSFIYSGYHIIFFLVRRFTQARRFRPILLTLFDGLMCLLWGIGILIEIIQYRCPPGDAWCDFYNTSIFFGFTSFALFIVLLGWDVFNLLCGKKARYD